MISSSYPRFKLVDSHVYDDNVPVTFQMINESTGLPITKFNHDYKFFTINLFGKNERGETACIRINDFMPFFYLEVDGIRDNDFDGIGDAHRKLEEFIRKQLDIRSTFMKRCSDDDVENVPDEFETTREAEPPFWDGSGPRFEDRCFCFSNFFCIQLCSKKKLYGFHMNEKDGNFAFFKIQFRCLAHYNKIKSWWYKEDPLSAASSSSSSSSSFPKQKAKKGEFRRAKLKTDREELVIPDSNAYFYLYEANIPPLLRFFHLRDISPSGWIEIRGDCKLLSGDHREHSRCTFEYVPESFLQIFPLDGYEKCVVPYTVCSFDIEANSSHGDFPLPKKTYRKFASNVMDVYEYLLRNGYAYMMMTKFPKVIAHGFIVALLSSFKTEKLDDSIPGITTWDELWDQVWFPSSSSSSSSIDADPEAKKMYDDVAHLFDTIFFDQNVGYLVSYKETKDVFEGTIRDWLFSTHFGDDKYLLCDEDFVFDAGLFVDDNDEAEAEEDEEEEDDQIVREEIGKDNDDIDDIVALLPTKKRAKKAAAPAATSSSSKKLTLLQLLGDTKRSRDSKITIIDNSICMTWVEKSIMSTPKPFPKVQGDQVTFIGCSFHTFAGSLHPPITKDICIVLGESDSSSEFEIRTRNTEGKVLAEFAAVIRENDPDFIVGYNIFGFDYTFMHERATACKVTSDFLDVSRLLRNRSKFDRMCEMTVKLASGTHELKYMSCPGRVQIDLLNHLRREENLPSYKLDYVSGYFLGDFVANFSSSSSSDPTKTKTKVQSQNLAGLSPGNFIHFEELGNTRDYIANGAKFLVESVDHATSEFIVVAATTSDFELQLHPKHKIRWCLAKDDVSPKQIFEWSKESDAKRFLVAKYCIQDCRLVLELLKKLDVLTGFVEMSNICSVPLNFLVLRGQGIKLTSYVSKKCMQMNVLMRVVDVDMNDSGYEGATVLAPKTDFYLDSPVACVDYASLYPSCMIAYNISHDSKLWTRDFALNEATKEFECISESFPDAKKRDAMEALIIRKYGASEVFFQDIEYKLYAYRRKTEKAAAKKIEIGKRVVRYVNFHDPSRRNIMPLILRELLQARKATRHQMKGEKDEFMRNVLDKRQLAYKLTSNSLYGQSGARTSTFYDKDVAASTTAMGRNMLMLAKSFIEKNYRGIIVRVCDNKEVLVNAEYIYGDTDSVFFRFNPCETDGTAIRGQAALEITIELARRAGALFSKFQYIPHDLEYEKTFMPFILLSKKRYVGMMYETDPKKCKRKEMGIVLKRRDNAPIVKMVYGGLIDILMTADEKAVGTALAFLEDYLSKLKGGDIEMDKLVVSKSLRADYKNPLQIAHKVLADRMFERDRGNKMTAGHRVPYVYIKVDEAGAGGPNKVMLQGDKIESPDYVLEHKLRVDYEFYITNQIMKPVKQLFGLMLDQIMTLRGLDAMRAEMEVEMSGVPAKIGQRYEVDTLEYEEKVSVKRDDVRGKYVERVLFQPFLTLKPSKRALEVVVATASSASSVASSSSSSSSSSKRSKTGTSSGPRKPSSSLNGNPFVVFNGRGSIGSYFSKK